MRYLSVFAATVILNLLSGADVRAELPQGSRGWCTVMPGNIDGCGHATAYAACKAQYNAWGKAPDNQFIGAYPDGPVTAACDWTRFNYGCVGGVNSCGTVLPTGVDYACRTGYTYQAPGRCVPNRLASREDEAGGPAGQCTSNPVVLRTGAKVFTATDFQTDDGKLGWGRSYRSLSGGNIFVMNRLPAGFGQSWRHDYSMEFHIPPFGSAATPFSLHTPSGVVYEYVRQEDGSGFVQPTKSLQDRYRYRVELLTAPPSDPNEYHTVPSRWRVKEADGGQWILSTLPSLAKDDGRSHVIAVPLARIRPDGYQLNFRYDDRGALVAIADTFGRTIRLTWRYGLAPISATEVGPRLPMVITRADLPDGTWVAYTYDSASGAPDTVDRLRAVQHRAMDGTVLNNVRYEYGDARFPHHVTRVIEIDGIVSHEVTYDGLGRATMSSLAQGVERSTIRYTDGNTEYQRLVTNSLGKQSTYIYRSPEGGLGRARFAGVRGLASTNCPASLTSATWDEAGNMLSSIDEEGRKTTRTFTSTGLVATETVGAGSSNPETTRFSWNAERRPTQIVREGLKVNLLWSGARLVGLRETDTKAAQYPGAPTGQVRAWGFTYGTGGLVTSVDGPLPGPSDRTVYRYNPDGYLSEITDPMGLITRVITWNGRGQPTSVLDPNGVRNDYVYDGLGRLVQATTDAGSEGAVWRLIYSKAGTIARVIDPTGSYLAFQYDAARRLTGVTNGRGERITYAYNAEGGVTRTIARSAAAGSIQFDERRAYDELGRLIGLVTGTGQTWRTGWDRSSLPKMFIDPRGGQDVLAFDAVRRLVSRRAQDGGVTDLAYDRAGNLVRSRDPRLISTAFRTNGFGEVVQEISPDRGTITSDYDQRGLLIRRVDPRGVVSRFAYDASGRLLARSFPASAADAVTYRWDDTSGGNRGRGRLTAMTDRSGTTSWTWDTKGRVVQETRTIEGGSFTTRYGWDNADRLASITYPSGRIARYAYDAAGQIASVTTQRSAASPIVPIVSQIGYAPFGEISSAKQGNGLLLSQTFDTAYRLRSVRLASGSGSAVYDTTLTYGDGINVTAIIDRLDTRHTIGSMTYDAVQRLTGARMSLNGANVVYGYAYDRVGNRVIETRSGGLPSLRSAYTYPATSNRLKAADIDQAVTSRFSYDAAGNIVVDDRTNAIHRYGYDVFGRLANVSRNGATVGRYLYDGAHRLASSWEATSSSGTAARYVYQLGGGGMFDELMPDAAAQMRGFANRILAEVDESGRSSKEYVWLGDRLLAIVEEASSAAPRTLWVTNDHLGRPVQLTNASGSVEWRGKFHPFGQIMESKGGTTPALRFPGQWAQTTGLYWNWHRHYDPRLGRYVQPDQLGLADGNSVFGYALQNPLSYTDAEGRLSAIGYAVGAVGNLVSLIDRQGNEERDGYATVFSCTDQVGEIFPLTFGAGSLTKLYSSSVVGPVSSAFSIAKYASKLLRR